MSIDMTKVWAHRGASAYAPENTIPAFQMAMEMGADAVMAYTAIASAGNIPLMARAFKHAIESGREAYLSGLGTVTEGHAVPSSPTNAADYLH